MPINIPISERIDRLDRKILSIITTNARLSSKEVADMCQSNRAVVHQRIQRLTELGVISGSAYKINEQVLGYSISTYVGVTLERGSMYRRVIPELEKIPEVIECHYITGPYSLLVKLVARDNAHLMELLSGRIQMIHGVTGTETLMALETSICRPVPVVEQAAQAR